MLLQDGFRAARLQQGEVRDQSGRLALEARRIDVEQRAAADGHDRRVGAHDEPVTGPRDQRRFETKPREGRLARRELGPVEQERARHDLARPDVEPHTRARSDRPWGVLQELEGPVDEERRDERAGKPDDVAAGDRGPLEPLEVDRRALAGLRRGHGMPMGLQPADLGFGASRIDFHAVVHGERARGEGAGDDGAKSLDGEHAIDGQPRKLVRLSRGHRLREAAERGAQIVEPLARLRGHRQNRRALEKRGADGSGHVLPDQLEPVGLDQIGLGQRDEPGPDVQQGADREVFTRLRHHTFIRRDHQHREIDAANTGQHVLDEALVTGDVDDLDGEPAHLLEERES